MIEATEVANRFTASASSIVTSGLLRIRSKSSSFCVMPIRWIVNESAPRSETIASVTAAFTPVISATTVMIDDTATMLPSSVSIDLSLLAQIDAAPASTDSNSCDMTSLLVVRYFGVAPGFGAVFTRSPSYMPRTESNGPVIT